ncbi:DapH/DapD/GlmU-related protein [Streptococcus hongkongensis]|nr:acetyltransferase [Streptococcus uberis]
MGIKPKYTSFKDSKLFEEAIALTMAINNSYHQPHELRDLLSQWTGETVPESLRLFPPFYTDFGKNLGFGEDVFVNSGCHFQDQGGITIGRGTLIGHNVVMATVNHALEPSRDQKKFYAPIDIGQKVWVGSNVTILPGVTVGDWPVIAARAVVTKDVLAYTVVGGVPAKVIKAIDPES